MTTAVDTRIPADGAAASGGRVPKVGPRRRLFAKYALALVGLVSLVLLVNGLLNVWFSYDEARDAAIRLQREKADAAAQHIEEFISAIEKQIGWTTATQWASSPIDQRRFDYGRLQRQVPAITELIQLDGQGHEQLKVSRLAMDVVGTGADYSADPRFTEALAKKVWFGPVYFRKESEPYMTMAVAQSGRNAGVTVAEVNLKLIWDVITAIKIGKSGYAYVVDGEGRLIAHPDISRVLRNTDLSALPQVAAARSPAAAGTEPTAIVRNLDGRRVLSASAEIPRLGWLVFVEQPISEALAPLYTTVLNTGLLLMLGLAVAILAGLLLARRMTGPIRVLDAGAARIGAGALDHRIAVNTGDELEELAKRFNTMAADLQSSYADLEKKVEDRTAELKEALDQQTATAEVLGVINSSPGDLAPVFDAMLEKATRLSNAAFGIMQLYDGDRFRTVATRGMPPALTEFLLRTPRQASPHSAVSRILEGEDIIQFEDMTTEQAYLSGDARQKAFVELGGTRTYIAVALRKDGRLLGTIAAYRQEVRPFTDKQIALLQNFAAQAVIAMENARLITETREALEQQTATAEVLGVINSSPGDLAPVFDAMLEKATRLCDAGFGILWTYNGECLDAVAMRGVPAAFVDFAREPLRPGPNTGLGQVLRGERLVHIADIKAGEAYRSGDQLRAATVELAGARTLLLVPLRKEDALLGIFSVYRQEVRPFSDKQIALLQNFAAQAVIAIENARLITETHEALDQQTATAEVLGVINSSPGDLTPVFDAMLEKALHLCEAAFGTLYTYDGELMHAVAVSGASPEYAAYLKRGPHRAGPAGAAGRLIRGEPVVHIADVTLDEGYRSSPLGRAVIELGKVRTVLAVPLRKEATPVGFIIIYRREVRPFTDKQIALLENFAAQAVIAMENARLITETREALEQQTATAEVLGVINSSPGDLAPVFDAMLERAMRLCGGSFGVFATYEGEHYRVAATRGLPPGLAEFVRDPIPIQSGSMPERLRRDEDIIQIPDIAALGSEHRTPGLVAMIELGKARTALWVGLRKDGVPQGFFGIYRQEVRPFTDKQIALLQNFAAQAVIAMENARLITETREALEQQTATAEVLQVINSSPGDLFPVFDAILEKAHSLCGVAQGSLELYDGETFHAVATRGLAESFANELRRGYLASANPVTRPLIDGQPFTHIDDITQHEFPFTRNPADTTRARTLLCVPLRRDGKLLGMIVSARLEVRRFADKQIALLQNFAAQAVIAMENARLITETREALEQQTATAEVLGVINSSPGDLAPVFDAILQKAHSLCGAAFGALLKSDGEHFRAVALHGIPEVLAKVLRDPIDRSPNDPVMRLVRGEPLVHIPDTTVSLAQIPADDVIAHTAIELAGVRTLLTVPLRKDNVLLGVITAYRQEVRPFTDKQIVLLQNFAAQAVIAMENARLINETREALEQQTATAEVLQVINSSPGDLTPVFDAMLEKATRLCGADHGGLQLWDGEKFRAVATRGFPEAMIEFARRGYAPGPNMPSRRIVEGERVAHCVDMAEIDDPIAREAVELSGARTLLYVALRKDDKLLGQIVAVRQEVRPFSDKQIALLQNFAAQAVIAMENARLITETREALEQQTATAEVLQVINSSPGDLAPVFQAILEKAHSLCGVAYGSLHVYDGERFRAAAVHDLPEQFAKLLRQGYRGSDAPWGRSLLGGDRLVHISDLTEIDHPLAQAAVELGEIRTALFVPLRRDDTLLGMIVSARLEVRPFAEKEIALLESFAAQAVIAMENARLITELRQRTHDLQESLEYQTASGDVLKVISQSGAELEPVLDTLVETAAGICRADSGFIFRLHDGRCRMAASFGIPAEYRDFQVRNPIVPGRGTLAGRTVIERRAVHIEDAATDPEYTRAEAVQLGGQRTMLGVPLVSGRALIGVITLARSRVEPFTEKQIALVATFADQAVIAIENARLFDELRARTAELGRSVEELKMLSEVGRAVSSTLDLRAVLSAILTASLGLTWANAGAIFRYSRAERAFRLVEAVGWDEALTRSVGDLHLAETETAMGEAVARRMPVQLADTAQRASNPLRDITLAAGFHSALVVPLVGAERALGAIILMRQEAGEFPAETVRLMQTLASQSVLAIQNARLFREIADKSEQLALASQHKSQFLANMSHELRTPLNAILGYAELLVDGIYGVLPDRPKGVLERIQNNGKHLLALINDVLDLAKIEAGQLALTLEDYALAEVVRSVVTATEPLATSKGLKFTAVLQDGMPIGHGDARRVSQVLLNLVGNAIKFTEAGEVEIRASVAGGQFVLIVRDTGPGIPDADQERIFGEFQQIDNTNTRNKGGTGLGLAISKRMVELQGGTISVESVLGQGSTFRVVLPVHVDEMMEAAE